LADGPPGVRGRRPSRRREVEQTLSALHLRLATLSRSVDGNEPKDHWQTAFVAMLDDLSLTLASLYAARLRGALSDFEARVLLPGLEDVRALLRRPARAASSATALRVLARAQERLRAALLQSARPRRARSTKRS
jgi:hypothetical protein